MSPTSETPAPDPALEALDRLVGTWRISTVTGSYRWRPAGRSPMSSAPAIGQYRQESREDEND